MCLPKEKEFRRTLTPERSSLTLRAVCTARTGILLTGGLLSGLVSLTPGPAAAQQTMPAAAAQPTAAATSNAPDTSTAQPGVPFTADTLSHVLPPSVYFQGRTASLQLRNAAGINLGGQILWASLVDTSGYSSSVQEKYQFYMVTEGPLRFGDANLPAGAYGAGFQGDRFVVMDLGGHTVAQGALMSDAGMHRPRPLEIVASSPSDVRLYVGRRWVSLRRP